MHGRRRCRPRRRDVIPRPPSHTFRPIERFAPDSGLTREASSPSLMGMTAFARLFDMPAAVSADVASRATQQAWLWWWDSTPPRRPPRVSGDDHPLKVSPPHDDQPAARRVFLCALHGKFRKMYMTSNLAETPVPAPLSLPEPAEAALARLYAGTSLDEAEAETLFSALVDGRLAEPAIAAMLIALRLKGETADGTDRRGAGAARRRRAVRTAGLSLRRHLRDRRRRLGIDQRLDRRRLRRRRGGPAGRQARQPLGHLALRLGRRAGGSWARSWT